MLDLAAVILSCHKVAPRTDTPSCGSDNAVANIMCARYCNNVGEIYRKRRYTAINGYNKSFASGKCMRSKNTSDEKVAID